MMPINPDLPAVLREPSFDPIIMTKSLPSGGYAVNAKARLTIQRLLPSPVRKPQPVREIEIRSDGIYVRHAGKSSDPMEDLRRGIELFGGCP